MRRQLAVLYTFDLAAWLLSIELAIDAARVHMLQPVLPMHGGSFGGGSNRARGGRAVFQMLALGMTRRALAGGGEHTIVCYPAGVLP